jgi:hypothetical protein
MVQQHFSDGHPVPFPQRHRIAPKSRRNTRQPSNSCCKRALRSNVVSRMVPAAELNSLLTLILRFKRIVAYAMTVMSSLGLSPSFGST